MRARTVAPDGSVVRAAAAAAALTTSSTAQAARDGNALLTS